MYMVRTQNNNKIIISTISNCYNYRLVKLHAKLYRDYDDGHLGHVEGPVSCIKGSAGKNGHLDNF